MVDILRKRFALIFLLCAITFFYAPIIVSLLKNEIKLPLPSDLIVGLYHPYRDFYADSYPRGIPFKNFLISDPVRQTYLWKELVVDTYTNGNLPTWNPYEMAGKPLLSNFQSGALYPINVLFFLKPFFLAWSAYIVLQSFLVAIFTYLYLRNLKLNTSSATIGAAAFTFSGFSVSWLEWGNILHTALWLPLILLAIDKAFESDKNVKILGFKIPQKALLFFLTTVFLVSSFFAGHLQIFFYLYVVVIGYFFLRFVQYKSKQHLILFGAAQLFFLLITAIQWIPTAKFILLSSRGIDQNFLLYEGWFLPYRHVIQLLVPDFFGNPATLNYWGTWNYAELVSYIGVVPFLFSLYSFFTKRKEVVFFTITGLLALAFALPMYVSQLPFVFNIPFISSAQPTRLLFVFCFSISILSAFGASYLFKVAKFNIKTVIPIVILIVVFIMIWILTLGKWSILFENAEQMLVAKRNLSFPTAIFIISIPLILVMTIVRKKITKEIVMAVIMLIVFLELLRFGQKFTTFASSQYLYPVTQTINYLKQDKGIFRVATADRRIMPPNFLTHYKLQTIEGYDPLYLKSYAEYVVAMERNAPTVTPPYGFNRIITPQNYNSPLFDLLNVKYVLSFDELPPSKFEKVFEEGTTKVFRNKNVYSRAFFVEQVVNSNDILGDLFKYNLSKTALVENPIENKQVGVGEARIISYKENEVSIATKNNLGGFLVVSDVFYPTWEVYIDGVKSEIIKTNYSFRGVFVPKGNHSILFKDTMF